jgi:hypothetical protein
VDNVIIKRPSRCVVASERFDIVSSGPVDYVPEGEAFRITGTATASGTVIGESGSFTTSELARPDFQTGINHVDGEAVVAGSNGDELYIHYFGESPVPNMETGDFADDLQFSITGGTGRFEGATGSGRLTAHGNVNARPCVVESHLVGTIELALVAS